MKQVSSQRCMRYASVVACFLLVAAFLSLYNHQRSQKDLNPHAFLPNNIIEDNGRSTSLKHNPQSPRISPSTNFLDLAQQDLPVGPYYPYPRRKNRLWQKGWKQSHPNCKGPGGKIANDFSSDLLKTHSVSLKSPNPIPMFGAFHDDGLDDAHCFDRDGRLDPYGLKDDFMRGDNMLVEWDDVDWGFLQDQCIEDNRESFGKEMDQVAVSHLRMPETNDKNTRRSSDSNTDSDGLKAGQYTQHATSRKAVVLRGWDTVPYTSELRQHLRSVITELTLHTGGEYAVYLLVEIKDLKRSVFTSPTAYRDAVAASVPQEFHNITLLFNEPLLQAWYPKIPIFNGQAVHMNQPIQLFSLFNPQFTHVWGIELDVRYTGNWYNFLSSVHTWARNQPRKLQWERAAKFYIPSHHLSYSNFTSVISAENPDGGVWGPITSAAIPKPIGPEPPSLSPQDEDFEWGVGEEADDITPSPIIDTNGTGIFDKNIMTGFPAGTARRALMVTPVKALSRRLLSAMHEAQVAGLDMRSELFAHTIAVAHGLKVAAVPLPMYFNDPTKSGAEVNEIFNENGGKESVFVDNQVFVNDERENIMRAKGNTTFWWRLEFEQYPRQLYRRWYGLDEKGRRDESTGRLCLPGLLLHPVKDVVAEDEGK